MYRCRIGSFNSSFKAHNSKCSTSSDSEVSMNKKLFLLMMLILLFSCTVAALQAYNTEALHTSYYPTFPNQPISITNLWQNEELKPWPPPYYRSSGSPPSSSQGISGQPLISFQWAGVPVASRWRVLLCTGALGVNPLQQADTDILPHSAHNWLSSEDRNFLAKMTHGNRRERGLKILHWNKEPSFLQTKHQEVETIIAGHKPHILGLSEANLWKDHDITAVQFTDYQLHTCSTVSNPALNVSRVVVYTHNSVIVKRRHDLENDNISSIWLEVGLPHKRKILMCHAYREWKHLNQNDTSSSTTNAQLERWLVFLDQWERALLEDKEVIVAMDANIDFLKWTRSNLPANDSTSRLKPLIEELFSRIFPHGVSQMVTVPTRMWAGQVESGLDHIYTNRTEKISEVYAEYTGGSDHKLIKVTRYSKSIQRRARYVRKRCFKQFNEQEFCRKVEELSWFDIYMCEDANHAAEILTHKLSAILDTMAPVRTVQCRSQYAPWLTPETKELMKERDSAQKIAASTGDSDDWRYYKNKRNTVTARLRQEKNLWESKRLSHSENSPNTLWKNMKSWLNWKSSGPPSQLFSDGVIVNSPAGLAETMNKFFTNKVRLLREGIQANGIDPLKILRETMQDRTCTFGLKPVKPEHVLQIMKALKNSKSTGLDHLDTFVIKLVAPNILPALTHIINLSIRDGVFPAVWKKSKIVPLLKKGDALDPKNYRPVALLPIFSKILERAVFVQLVEYLETNNLLHPNHHGSRGNHSTTSALIQMYDTWLHEVEEEDMVGVMMVDLSAAFDMVDHDILLEKLKLHGLDSPAIQWFHSYLADRSQTVCVDGCLSPFLKIHCGVPQGSVLGPLLYILFTNDLPDSVHEEHDAPLSITSPNMHCPPCGSLVNYVDDGTYSFASKDPLVLSRTLTSKYKTISNYMMSNRLVINADKTHLVVMGKKRADNTRGAVSLVAGTHVIYPTETEKLLGCNIHQSLKWKEHIQTNEKSLIRQLTGRLNALRKLAVNAPFKTRLMAANSVFISVLSYLIPLWGASEGYLTKALQVVQNKAARCVTKVTWFTATRQLLLQCGWMSIRQLVFYHTVLTMRKILKSGRPLFLKNRLSNHFPYQTRQATGGHVRHPFDTVVDGSFISRGTKAYNSIPESIKSTPSLPVFKKKLKTWTLANIPID